MIKKTNTIMFRIDKANKSRAKSSWFAPKKSYSEDLMEDHKIRSFIKSYPACSGLDDVIIKRNNTRVQVIIRVEQVGVVIGKQGVEIENIRTAIKKIVGGKNVWVEAEELKKPNLSANIVANNLARQIEKRVRAFSAMREAERAVMKSGALGFKVVISGRHGGADIARSEKRSAGTVPTQTIRQNIKYAAARANTTYGVFGIKVWIALGDYSTSDKIENSTDFSKNSRSKKSVKIKRKSNNNKSKQ